MALTKSSLLSELLLPLLLVCVVGFKFGSASPVNATLSFPTISQCQSASVEFLLRTDCSQTVVCNQGAVLGLSNCVANYSFIFGFNATYYLGTYGGNPYYYTYDGNIFAISPMISQPGSLAWNFGDTDNMVRFYSSVIYNTTCSIVPNKNTLTITASKSKDNSVCTVPKVLDIPIKNFTFVPL